jgi:glucose/arabinose dehydrogenase
VTKHPTRWRVVVLAFVLALLGPSALPAVAPVEAALAAGQLAIVPVTGGLTLPIGVTNAGDGSGRLFVVLQDGLVRVVKGGTLQAGSFLDVRAKVARDGGEQGLLGLAFHPDFASNRRLFVSYTRTDGDLVVSRFTANAAGTSASSGSEVMLFRVEHSSAQNHNGGSLAFGPDGFLYIGVGDGGGGGDPDENGQDLSTPLGKLLRIDVDGTGRGLSGAYSIPPSNPVGQTDQDEIWQYGLRNPWRISFDRATGALWIGDVGQGDWEEIDRDPAPGTPARNWGWDVMEGKHCFEPSSGCDTSGKTLPIHEYDHGDGCSVTGGNVYRGQTQRDLQGVYVFADYCFGTISTIAANGTTATLRLDTSALISSFGESESGELYMTDRKGGLYRVVAPEFSDIATSPFLDAIHWLVYEGLTAGCSATRFCPTASVTREQMAIFLDRALDLPATATDAFSDDEGLTGEAAINRLYAAGITAGCTPTRFCPTASVTREEMAVFLDRALDLPATSQDPFDDDEGRTGEAAINRVYAAGITSGCGPARYCPNELVTRGQMAAFLQRAFD